MATAEVEAKVDSTKKVTKSHNCVPQEGTYSPQQTVESRATFSYFSKSTSLETAAVEPAATDETATEELVLSTVEPTTDPATVVVEPATEPTLDAVESAGDPTLIVKDDKTANNLVDASAVRDFVAEPAAAQVVLEAQAIVEAVMEEASFISSFDTGSTSVARQAALQSASEEEAVGDEDEISFVVVSEDVIVEQAEGSSLEEDDNEVFLEKLKEEILDHTIKEEEGAGVKETKDDISKYQPSKVEEAEHVDNEGMLAQNEERDEVKISTYKRAGTWGSIRISTAVRREEGPPSPAEDKVKLLELKMMSEKMERMVEMLELEMRAMLMMLKMEPLVMLVIGWCLIPLQTGV
jgi:hypothetical protein